MAKKPKAKGREKIANFKDMVFVINNLDDEMLEACDRSEIDWERFGEFLEKLVDDGMSVKVDYDSYSDCFMASASGVWTGFKNTGIAVSARGENVVDALKILHFKIDVVADWDLVQFKEKSATRRNRG